MDPKKVKDVKARPEPPDGSCHFFVERKRRYCRFTPAKGSDYCAEHATIYDVSIGHETGMFSPWNNVNKSTMSHLTIVQFCVAHVKICREMYLVMCKKGVLPLLKTLVSSVIHTFKYKH